MIFNLNPDEHAKALANLQLAIGYQFHDQNLLKEAFIHPSYAMEQNSPKQNQRLEYLGDAVLQIILSEYLFHEMPDAQEGILTRMRSNLVNEQANASYTLRLGLDKMLLLGHGECTSNGRKRPSLLGDLFEAFLGALYLDGGLEFCREFVLKLLPNLREVEARLEVEDNPKGTLLMFCQGHKIGVPQYQLVERTGPVHAPVFTVRVTLKQQELSRASGNSMKVAERNAAKEAYLKMKTHYEKEISRPTVVALDFDGVVCNSADETGASGWQAARKIWPSLFRRKMPGKAALEAFRKVRPWLETGYEAILLTKIVQENIPITELVTHHQAHFARIMRENNLTVEELKQLMGQTRDEWIQRDLPEWVSFHSFYPGVLDALKAALAKGDKRILIITTKQERFVQAILKSAGVDFPEENLFGLDKKMKKPTVLAELLKEDHKEINFVEDRVQTLLNVEQVKELNSVKLFYAKWGYCTAAAHDVANQDPRIHVIGLEDFPTLLLS